MSNILFKPTHLPISKPFHALLANILSEHQAKSEVQVTSKEVVMNFRDSSYSAEDGGFHPVEIALSQSSDGQWSIEYITDFAYVGNHFPELERCLDFDFQRGDFFTAYHGWNPIVGNRDARELYQLWESNFLAYVATEAFDDISLTSAP
ncbi:TPA: DUF2787 domain-containing protein [Vibrio cholerae]